MSSANLDLLYEQGVAAIRAGDKAKARELLGKVVEQDQLHEEAWLWLSAAVETNEERILCLKNVLTINPKNETALKGMRKLGALPAEGEPSSPGADNRPDWVRSMSGEGAGAASAEPPPDPFAGSEHAAEGWRKKLYEEAAYTSEASLVKEKDKGPIRTFDGLVNAWLSALIFKVPGDYAEEVEYGSLGHIATNVGVAVLLQVLAIILFFGILLATHRTPNYIFNAVSQSSAAMARTASAFSLVKAAPPALRPAMAILFPDSQAGVRIPTISSAELASFGALLVAVLIWNVLATFVFLMFQSLVVSRVSEGMGGKGNVFGTTIGLSLALVASSMINVPLAMVAAVVPFGVLMLLLAAAGLYQFAQSGLAISAAHRLNILVSLGAVVISDVVTNIGLSCAGALLVYIVSASGLR